MVRALKIALKILFHKQDGDLFNTFPVYLRHVDTFKEQIHYFIFHVKCILPQLK